MNKTFPRTDALADLSDAGVSIWLDDLSRELLETGALKHLIDHWHVVGVTTNPTIFASALSKGERYTTQLAALAASDVSVDEAVFIVTTDDVRAACDELARVYRHTSGVDGRVSIEVDPRLARDAQATTDMARRLWQAVDRPNLHIKIPATREALPAITAVVAEGISVNVTLIFSLDRYREVMNAYVEGLNMARAAGRDLSCIASVASFFISRVDGAVDAQLADIGTTAALSLRGRAAIANARLAHAAFEEVFTGRAWTQLAVDGAHKQRPLWASTGVKNPAYPDTMYVTELVTAGTVNTMPSTILEAMADHGVLAGDTVRTQYGAVADVMAGLADVGVDLDVLTEQLEREGLDKFEASWAELTDTVATELEAARGKAPSIPTDEGPVRPEEVPPLTVGVRE